MYHPTAMLTIAHHREAELIREADAYRLPRTSRTSGARLARRVIALAFAAVVLVPAITWLLR
jgi:hypothetical protein